MINFTASNTKFLTATLALIAIVGSACGTAASTASSGTDNAVADTVVTETVVAEAPSATAPGTSTPVAEQPAAAIQTTPVAPPHRHPHPSSTLRRRSMRSSTSTRISSAASSFRHRAPRSRARSTPRSTSTRSCRAARVRSSWTSEHDELDPDFAADGYFGEDTYEAVTGLQASFGMHHTGVIDDVLVEMIHLSILHSDAEEFDDVDGDVDGDMISDEGFAEFCESSDPAPGEELDWDLIDDCETLGFRLVSGD